MPLESEPSRSSKAEIYFLSSREPDPQMIDDLDGTITAHFKGGVKDIHRQGAQIAFTETVFSGENTIKACHLIPTESIVVINAPILLQKAWLDAGVHTLLIPQIKQKIGKWRGIEYKYCGLLRVHKVEVVTSQWAAPHNSEQETKQTIAQSDPTTKDVVTGQTLSLLNFFGLPSAQQVGSHSSNSISNSIELKAT
ncbi:MAG: hypothetical protein KME15_26615 [Drouetiella hepatica Uher 2000/2452]|jgi:hypothetical protein|uniref:Uncharacterized protein n=1 Tax=Drouetiella hepatica Uher 2000/2452 TaxID=904376 RepID=A0A951UQ36_9CYAN|nr:hypothetical protein [Drouetiella hepatica Uher 2000/2452]